MNILIETERLILKEFNLSDAKNIYELNADWNVIRYTGDQPFTSIEEAYHFINTYTSYKDNGFGRWAVVLKSSNRFIGWCGFKKHTCYIDLGFRFFKKDWNKGYATESAKACLKYGFNHLGINEAIGRVHKKIKDLFVF